MSIVDDDRIGVILVTMCVVTRSQLKDALARHEAGDPRRVTEILGVDDDAIASALQAQGLLRGGRVIEAAKHIADAAFSPRKPEEKP